MIVVHGIKNCDSVKKALKFLKQNGIEYNFRDFKENAVSCQEVQKWLSFSSIDKLFNTRGTTYRKLNLKALNLNDEDKVKWLCKENLLIKRPVIEYDKGLLVGFDEEIYKSEFI